MNRAAEWFDAQTLIPDLLRAEPRARPILDRYGLHGCGGPLGPVESLAFFAKAHDVPLDRLLEELRAALEQPESPAVPDAAEPGGSRADLIYRPFFKAGIAVVLTLGATWGAYLLWQIGWHGSFRAVGLHEVNAHGHAQIFGWVGLFVMGFAYQAFPRFKHSSLAHPRLAFASLGLMLLGIVGRSVCEPLIASWGWLRIPAVGATVLEVAAIALFVLVIVQTFRRSGKPLAVYDYYILSALFWFIVQALAEATYFTATVSVADGEQLRRLVATWQGSLRKIQIHGFALLMILGVSQRIFPYFYGLPAPHPRRGLAALVCLNAAIVGESVGLVLMQTSGHAWAGLWYTSVIVLAGTVAMLVWDWHIFTPAREPDRSLKFLRTAYAWLFVSLGMLVLVPAYQYGLLPWLAPESAAAQLGFSHAYYGAIRHAITVGFISLMIVGVAAKVVPTLNGVDVRALTGLWLPFLLINTGCALRVSGQTLTDFTPRVFGWTGASGLLETLGLTLWGIHLWSIMAGHARLRVPADSAGGSALPFVPGSPIQGGHVVGQVLDQCPGSLETFLAFGFRPLGNPLLRKTLARRVTISRACRTLGVDEQELLDSLNAAQSGNNRGRRSLPVVTVS